MGKPYRSLVFFLQKAQIASRETVKLRLINVMHGLKWGFILYRGRPAAFAEMLVAVDEHDDVPKRK